MARVIWISLGALLLLGCVAAPGYRGEVMENFDGSRFYNRTPMVQGFINMTKLSFQFVTQAAKWPESVAVRQQAVPPVNDGLAVTFINHATFLLQIDGVTILTDPVYSERASPFSFAGPRRVHDPGVPLSGLPDIDVILISHNHYDHLDVATLRKIAEMQENEPLVLAGLGNGALLSDIGLSNHNDMNWDDSLESHGLTFTFTECRHRSGRGLGDQMQTLWGSFVIGTPDGHIYFAGDTGYDSHFVKAGRQFGSFRLALLPIGAYEPRWFMKDVHLNPAEAVQAHRDLRSKFSIGMHYGTFQLTLEAIDRPEKDLSIALKDAGVTRDEFFTLEVGETRVFN